MSIATNRSLCRWLDGCCPATGPPLAQLTCGYRNASDRMVIVRCIGPESFFLERVVFPFELLSFLAPADSIVQIWTHGLGGPELIETLEATDLSAEPGDSQGASATESLLTLINSEQPASQSERLTA